MKLQWEFPLPTSERSEDHQYEAPIYVDRNEVLFPFGYRENTVLYVVDRENGAGRPLPLRSSVGVLPREFFFLPCAEGVVLYTGDLYRYRDGRIEKTFCLSQYGKVTSRMELDRRLFLVCSDQRKETLLCIDLTALWVVWECDVTSRPYQAGPISAFEGKLACYGRGELLFLSPESGEVLSSLRIRHADKLFCPIRLEEDRLALGFTNWSNAGILSYRPSTGKVQWKESRRFEGPQLKCGLHRSGRRLYWVKNDRELICVDEADGTELFRRPTAPWLYTELCFEEDRILYGTAGADGFLCCVRAEDGGSLWELPLKNGCAYFGRLGSTAVVGDFSKTLRQVDIANGAILRELPMDGEIVGQIAVRENEVYTVQWGDHERDISLVKITVE